METNYDAVRSLVAAVMGGLKGEGCWSGQVVPEVYHAAKGELERRLKVPVVSKSGLVEFMEDPYAYHWRRVSGEEERSEALRKGALIDCLTLTPELAGDVYVVEEINRRTNAGKARVAELEGAGKVIVSPEEYEGARKVGMLAREELGRRFGEYRTQVAAFFLTDEVCGEGLACPVVICGMFDVVPGDAGLPIVDLKTTSRSIVSEREVSRNMAEYGYGVQAAMYVDLAFFAMYEVRGFAFFYVTVSEPTRMRLVHVNMTDVELYRARYFEGLRAYAAAWKGDNWGGAVLPDMVYEVPQWDMKR